MLQRSQAIYEFVLMFIVASYAVLVFTDPSQHPFLTHGFIMRVDIGLSTAFGIEYVIRLWKAERKWQFVLRNWFDLIAIVPVNPHMVLARFLRLLRLARILKSSPFVRACLKIKQLRTLFLLLAGIILWSSAAMYFLEHGINPSMKTFGDALWWSVVTVTTVGYGDVYPVTGAGRVVAVVLMFASIGFLGSFATEIATNWRTFVETEKREEDATKAELRALVEAVDMVDAETVEVIRHILHGTRAKDSPNYVGNGVGNGLGTKM